MNISDRFTNQVLHSFENPQQSLYASAPMTKELRESGHPQFADLELGEQRSAQIASVFLDLSKFTWRSFWEEPEESARLAHAVMTGFVLSRARNDRWQRDGLAFLRAGAATIHIRSATGLDEESERTLDDGAVLLHRGAFVVHATGR